MILMIMSGWQIYNASPLFDFNFSSSITLGGWLGGALLWHFAAMWLLMVNGLFYVVLGFATGASAGSCCRSPWRGDIRCQGGADRQAVA
jgi:thiosulfate reductase cytochrome b subunit